ncbi:hypothetical protein FOQG_15916 [Fusarium oxysporum f. sp. raphani 54005]|uniref:Uncharacterized protein n=1 Tax=Fusarium oxysporum f. sp. raphani 54005 TaxID=1089458 RepID=X0BKR2_FUSOX|nr:hypothetical protein FOQG_15916 [Fusarium oxysporum f. sp. raphani 54005]
MMVYRKSGTQVSKGGKALMGEKRVVAARFRFRLIIRGLKKDLRQKLIAIIKDLSKTTEKKVLDILRNSTEEKHDGDISLLSIKDMSDAIYSVRCGKEEQQTASTSARMPEHYNMANIPIQTVGNAHRYWTRSQARLGRHPPLPIAESTTALGVKGP